MKKVQLKIIKTFDLDQNETFACNSTCVMYRDHKHRLKKNPNLEWPMNVAFTEKEEKTSKVQIKKFLLPTNWYQVTI